ncbi:MAG: universal stress protein [Thermoplasmatota archaeon]
MEEFESILIPTDASEANKKVIDKGLSLARLLGAKVTILFVVDTSTFRDVPPDELITTLRGHMEAKGNELLDEIEEEAEELGVEMEKSIVHGEPTKTIIEESEDHDLIVIGTHGRSGLSRLLVGSTSETIIRQAKCPVMVVRIEEE